jgi:dTDP-4-dehydrorhamnose reductase
MEKRRVMILGVSGCLGQSLAEGLSRRFRLLCPRPRSSVGNEISGVEWIPLVFEAERLDTLRRAVGYGRPDVIVNCVAVTPGSANPVTSAGCEYTNGVFPHHLAAIAAKSDALVVHLSTDAVFSGKKGAYTEDHPADPVDFYGQTKLLGELQQPNCVTLRTSFFGAFTTGRGFVNWLLKQERRVIDGYVNYRFTGLSSTALSDAIGKLILLRDFPSGIHHVGGPVTSKYVLLQRLSNRLGLRVTVRPVEQPVVDRTLVSSRFWQLLNAAPPTLDEMIEHVLRAIGGLSPGSPSRSSGRLPASSASEVPRGCF